MEFTSPADECNVVSFQTIDSREFTSQKLEMPALREAEMFAL